MIKLNFLSFLKKRKFFIILFFIWIFHVVSNFFWLRKDNTYFIYDSHKLFMSSLRILDLLKSLLFQKIFTVSKFYPEFVDIIMSPFYLVFGKSQDVAALINGGIFLGILLFATYKIGEKIANKNVGLLSAFLISMYPAVFNQLRVYMLDLPLAAMVTLSFYMLILTNKFRSRKFSFTFGLIFGLGVLTKVNYIIFIIAPLFLVVKRIFSEKNRSYFNRQLKNLVYTFVLTFLIISVYYFSKILITEGIFIKQFHNPMYKTNSFFTFLTVVFNSVIKIILLFINNQITFLLAVPFLVTLFFLNKLHIKEKSLLITWFVIPYIWVMIMVSVLLYYPSLMKWVHVRYTIPALPPIAILSSIGISKIKYNKIRKSIILFLILSSLFQYCSISYGIKFLPSELSFSYKKNSSSFKISIFKQKMAIPSSHYSHPKKNSSNVDKILRTLRDYNNNERKKVITVLPDIGTIWAGLEYELYKRKLSYKIYCDPLMIYIIDPIPFPDLFLKSDFIIDQKGETPNYPLVGKKVKEARNYFSRHIKKFELIEEISDGAKNILIYKNVSKK